MVALSFRGAHPLILRWPASLKPGQVNEDSVVSTVDLAPTLAELCGLDPMTGTDGLSFACLLRGEQRAWPRTEAFSCFNYMNNHPEIDQRNPDFDPELAQRFDQCTGRLVPSTAGASRTYGTVGRTET